MNSMEAYLDNSATTPVSEGVIEIIEKTMREDFGNPSSRHQKGVDAEKYLRQAKERIASTQRSAGMQWLIRALMVRITVSSPSGAASAFITCTLCVVRCLLCTSA